MHLLFDAFILAGRVYRQCRRIFHDLEHEVIHLRLIDGVSYIEGDGLCQNISFRVVALAVQCAEVRRMQGKRRPEDFRCSRGRYVPEHDHV